MQEIQDIREKPEGRNYDHFIDLCEQLQIRLTEKQLCQFDRYYQMLIEKNKVMNLTAVTEWEEVIVRHFADSLSLVKAVDLTSKQTVLDLGTGAGFPGIPLKIAFPDLEIVLMDSLNKRILFLQEVIEALSLKGITAVHGRAEELARKAEYREQFDLCVSRAVANLSSLSEYCLPFVKKGGRFISYKSGKASEEIQAASRAISLLGGKDQLQLVSFDLPGTDMSRVLVCIEKEKATPKKYPRKPGTPAKEPL